MKKPDRFERTVLAELKKQDMPGSPGIWLNAPDIVKLLRREHRAVVRLVRKVRDWQVEQLADNEDVATVILKELEQRAK